MAGSNRPDHEKCERWNQDRQDYREVDDGWMEWIGEHREVLLTGNARSATISPVSSRRYGADVAFENKEGSELAGPTDDVAPRFRVGLTALLLAIAGWGVADLILDDLDTWFSLHGLVELGFILSCLASVVYLWLGWMRTRQGLRFAEEQAVANEEERDQWRLRATKLLQGLGAEIDAQFGRWSLTSAEREVALLILKGLGHREAANVLQRSERTVRQHAVVVYRKSGLAGRAELAAFFLEDLLLPVGEK